MSVPRGRDAATATEDGGGEHACPVCCESFPDMDAFTDHMIRLDRPPSPLKRPRHQCDLCPKTLCSVRSLRRHVSQVHGGVGETTHECAVCSKRFRLVRRLKDHEATHVVDDANCLQRHQPHRATLQYGNERKFKCLVCYNAFSRRKTLDHHILNYHLQPN